MAVKNSMSVTMAGVGNRLTGGGVCLVVGGIFVFIGGIRLKVIVHI
ncbi:MAG: hypothetical protein NTV22_04850 [bacterium]|nr:hypothetical protein [bacterium]